MPDFSVVIPTFRRPKQLPEALASALGQAGVDLEVFVIDDCPDGSAQDIVAGLADDRVTYIRNPRPTGGFPSIVRNLAIPRLTGAYVHFLDDDDIVPEGHYAAAKQEFERMPRTGLLFGRVEPFGDGPPEQLEHERQYFAAAARNAARCARFGRRLPFAGWMLFGSALLVCSAGLVRRECVTGVGGFSEDMSLWEDTEFFCRVARRFGATFVDRVTLKYRIGSPSLMHAPDPTPEQRAAERDCAHRMWAHYRRLYGMAEFMTLAALTRGVLRYL
ncbi:MAG TPA: glycosyltransferase family 2 protein [Rhodopila sp.]|uniref:glycosyltransferase family 2 protein n=1 Tax=Rhodopila sp. TaxID=2480087 RepID=UPI002C946ABA|nr:glycosyltransferase family 2 protein [Rhodopila sp.]HVY18314.1 glycosyltransferase family 2 protein [Rhodopila sp.]